MGFIKFIFKIMGVFTIWQLNSINNQAFKCFLFPWRWILFYIQGESKKSGISKSMYIALRAIKIKQINF